MNRVSLPPNVPQLLSLQDPEGDYKPDLNQVEYVTTDGRLLVLDSKAATALNIMELKPGETFQVCKRVSGKRGELPHIEVWLTTGTEKDRAAKDAALQQPPPPQSPARPKRGKVREIRPEKPQIDFDFEARRRLGTGTFGPAPQPALYRKPPVRIPFNQAFTEAVKIVQAGLNEAHEQWSDASRQGAVSTILIAATKAGWVGPWERDA